MAIFLMSLFFLLGSWCQGARLAPIGWRGLLVAPITSTGVVGTSAYEELESFGFPVGLLPHSVTNYTLEKPTGGKFSLQLDGDCAAMLQGTYLIKYGAHISGIVSPGYIKHLKGVSVRAFFMDWTISGIRVHNEELVFEVGFTSAKFPLTNFEESPQCANGGLHHADM